MIQPTTAPVKKVELTGQQKLENFLFTVANLAYMVDAIRWYTSLCWHTRRQHHRFAGAPVRIELFGSDPESGLDILRDYGMRYAMGSLQWAIIENKVGLRLLFLVSKSAFDYADNILSQYAGSTFDVMTNPGCKRGQALRRPYAQRQRPVQPAKRPIAKLGKIYRAR